MHCLMRRYVKRLIAVHAFRNTTTPFCELCSSLLPQANSFWAGALNSHTKLSGSLRSVVDANDGKAVLESQRKDHSVWKQQVCFKSSKSKKSRAKKGATSDIQKILKILKNRTIPTKEKNKFISKMDKVVNNLDQTCIVEVFKACKDGKYINTNLFDTLGSQMLSSDDMVFNMPRGQLGEFFETLGCLYKLYEGKKSDFFGCFKFLMRSLVAECSNREKFEYKQCPRLALTRILVHLGDFWVVENAIIPENDIKYLTQLAVRRLSTSHHIEKCTAAELGHIFEAFGKLRFVSRKWVHYFSQEIVKRLRVKGRKKKSGSLENSMTSGIATEIFWAFHRLNHKYQPLLEALTHALVKDAENLKAEEYRRVFYALGRMQYDNEKLIGPLCKGLKNSRIVRNLAANEYADILYGLGECRHHNNKDLVEILVVEFSKKGRLSKSTLDDMVNVMHAMQTLNYEDDKIEKAITTRMLQKEKFSSLKGYHVMALLERFTVPERFNAEVVEAINNEIIKPIWIDQFSAKDTVKLVSNYAQLKQCYPKVLSTLFGRLQDWNESLDVEQCLEVVYNLAKGRDHMKLSFVGQQVEPLFRWIFDKIMGDVDIREAKFISRLLFAYSELQMYDVDRMQILLDEWNKLNGRFMAHLKDYEGFFLVLHACAIFNNRDPNFIRFATNMLHGEMAKIQDMEILTKCMWDIVVLGELTPNFAELLFSRLSEIKNRDFTLAEAQRVLLAWNYAKTLEGTEFNKEAKVLAKLARVKIYKEYDTRGQTMFEIEVEKVLNELGRDFESRAYIGDDKFLMVDFLVEDNVAIALEGPSKYTIHKYGGQFLPLGDTLLRCKLIESRGECEVLRIPYFEWQVMDAEQRHHWLRQGIDDALQNKH